MCLSFKDHLISTFLLCTLFGLNIFGKFLRFTLSRPNVITMLYVMTANFCEEAVYACQQREDKIYDRNSFRYREKLLFLTPSVEDCPFQVTFGINDRSLKFEKKIG